MKNFSRVYCAELEGIEAKLIEVETDINVGLCAFSIVGLADKALNEAKERVNAALKNSQIKPPNRENRRITVNLAPADIKKNGSQYDLAIAVGYLLASKQIQPFDSSDKIFLGELSLEGNIRPISGALSIARLVKKLGFKFLFVPVENAKEAAIIKGINVIAVSSLEEAINFLEGRSKIDPYPCTEFSNNIEEIIFDISEIKGQDNAKRALTVAAAGGHNILFCGSPGAGKTMLAQALISILPPLSQNEAIEVTEIYSASNELKNRSLVSSRPFRAPHHSASPASVIGGGTSPKPGEISLAHRGVLFLDELPEFRRDLLESLRQPLENGCVCVARSKGVLNFPARFTLVAAMNPCPCGYYGDDEKVCSCTAYDVIKYQKKLSGPLLDRIDIQIQVPRVKIKDLTKNKEIDNKESQEIKNKVIKARQIQQERFKNIKQNIYTNSEMPSKLVDEAINLNEEGKKFVEKMLEKSFISARGYYRMLKTARTIADLEESENVETSHLAEAFQYRIRES